MNMEEIVALSVKHNVSDLHLCNAWPARWRICGRVEIAPFTAPDVDALLWHGSVSNNRYSCGKRVRLILLSHWRIPGVYGPAHLRISRERHWR